MDLVQSIDLADQLLNHLHLLSDAVHRTQLGHEVGNLLDHGGQNIFEGARAFD